MWNGLFAINHIPSKEQMYLMNVAYYIIRSMHTVQGWKVGNVYV